MFDAIAHAAIATHQVFVPQHIANIVWGFGEIFLWRSLMTNVLQTSAGTTGLRFGDMHAVFWSLAHGLMWPRLRESFESCVA